MICNVCYTVYMYDMYCMLYSVKCTCMICNVYTIQCTQYACSICTVYYTVYIYDMYCMYMYDTYCIKCYMYDIYCIKEILNRRRGRQGFRTLCCDVFGLLKKQFFRNNNNKGSRSNVNKHELVHCESSIILLKKIEKVKDFSFIRKGPYYRDISIKFKVILPPPLDVCLSFVLLFTIFIIVVTQNHSSSAVHETSQQSVRKPYRPLLFNISLFCMKCKCKTNTAQCTCMICSLYSVHVWYVLYTLYKYDMY